MTPVIKAQVYFPERELKALHAVARKAGKSVAAMVREAVRKTWLHPAPEGPVALWSGKAPASVDHDAIYDAP